MFSAWPHFQYMTTLDYIVTTPYIKWCKLTFRKPSLTKFITHVLKQNKKQKSLTGFNRPMSANYFLSPSKKSKRTVLFGKCGCIVHSSLYSTLFLTVVYMKIYSFNITSSRGVYFTVYHSKIWNIEI